MRVGASPMWDAEHQALIERMAEQMDAIQEANAGRPDPLSRVLVGAEALRRPRLPEGNRSQVTPGADGFPVVPTEEA